jgi:hypothetical protein
MAFAWPLAAGLAEHLDASAVVAWRTGCHEVAEVVCAAPCDRDNVVYLRGCGSAVAAHPEVALEHELADSLPCPA